ncbi:helix-turn-helix domain-containing protein [Dactylosporangium matsuzakiense]|uniref:XRE family transcriptional regulator n=1 Tax=Dactylosporangium matsuzakiense TaxID=53360 RepID=A0A9W6KRM2_9ACTN|nr:XRE family transcriptional regulator [Dactylosporangium matsuzakiense]UWZ42750.1 helix-turn-helix transcriptional regulator [Dactylosporangium matsuzakiense]GLL05404.1 XRE family transcriptional regulator [Dactylosporangium matsuzakiense]
MSDTTLADKLDRLFRTVHPAGRGEYTYEEVAAAIRERGVMISHTYVWQLRKGTRDNPTKRHLEALAEFFGVNAAYFLDDDPDTVRRIESQLDLLAVLRDSAVRSVALRAAGLSAPSLEAIHGMIEHARRIEGLPPDPEPGPTAPPS